MRKLSELPQNARQQCLLNMALLRFLQLERERADHDPLVQEIRAELAGGGMSGYTKYWLVRERLQEMDRQAKQESEQ